jgi:hypothetical protein
MRSQVPRRGVAGCQQLRDVIALAWTYLNDSVCFMPPAGRVPSREVQ